MGWRRRTTEGKDHTLGTNCIPRGDTAQAAHFPGGEPRQSTGYELVGRHSKGSLTDVQDPAPRKDSGALVEKLFSTLRQ